MNTILTLQPDSAPVPVPDLAPAPQSATAPTQPPAPALDPAPAPDASSPRGNGKIPHLPMEQRDVINQMLDDGATYQTIIQKLSEQGVSLNGANLTGWFHGGYQEHLQNRERREQLTHVQQQLLDIARNDDSPSLSLAGLQLAVTQLSQQLFQLAPGAHQQSFQTDTAHYLRMLNTLARITKSLLGLKQYQDQAAQARLTMEPMKDPHRKLTDSETRAIVAKVDQILGIKPISVLAQEYRRKTQSLTVGNQGNEAPTEPAATSPASAPDPQPSAPPSSHSALGTPNSSLPPVPPELSSACESAIPSATADQPPTVTRGNPQKSDSPSEPPATSPASAPDPQPSAPPSSHSALCTPNSSLPPVLLVPETRPGVCGDCYRRPLLKTGQPFPPECSRCPVYTEPYRWIWPAPEFAAVNSQPSTLNPQLSPAQQLDDSQQSTLNSQLAQK